MLKTSALLSVSIFALGSEVAGEAHDIAMLIAAGLSRDLVLVRSSSNELIVSDLQLQRKSVKYLGVVLARDPGILARLSRYI